MSITRAFAILAPVAEKLLVSGQELCDRQGKVAFTSPKSNLFLKVDAARAGDEINVFIYAVSAERSIGSLVTWQGIYIGHIDFRYFQQQFPLVPSHQKIPANFPTVYWAVRDLKKIDPLAISELRGFDKATYYPADFVPEVPLLIEHP
jgi:hypothetical protein